jgi:formylglycine-generating enzyme required for sulfatase activity
LKEQGWCVLPPIKPWTNPLVFLKQALVEQFYKFPKEIQNAYAKLENEGLNAILPERSPRVLLVIDQFEELFTVCTNEQDRQEFIRLLAEGADREGRLTIATTMRADFVEQALQYPDLAKLIQRDRAFWLVPLEPSELREAIAKPARMQGYGLAEGLLEVICQDVEAEKNSLPLLEFALTELWEKRDKQKHQLTLTAYTAMGKLSGALNLHAKRLYDDLPSQLERDWARRLFLQLVRTGQDVRDTRQRQAKQFLLEMARSEEDRDAISNLLEIFAGKEGRLLTMSKENDAEGQLLTMEEENNVAFVDLAHEALMDAWEMFRDWRSCDRDLRRLGDRVKDAFQEFNNAKEEDKDKFLLPEGVVAQIEEATPTINDYLTTAQQEFVQRNQYKYKPWLDQRNLPEMVDIPSGTFWMGSPEGKGESKREKPYHKVTLTSFRMSKYPITQAQWRTVAMSPKIDRDLPQITSRFLGDARPLEQVNWYEAQEFCARLSKLTGQSYRLPSEAEWEYACRAGATDYTEYCFGDDDSQLDNYAWYVYNHVEIPRQVGQKLPNAWQLYDMHGSVQEWCEDDWHDDYDGAPNDGSAWIDRDRIDDSNRILRGGCVTYFPYGCRSASRRGNIAVERTFDVGFRVVCVVQ